jgi:uncharacterized membrane protein
MSPGYPRPYGAPPAGTIPPGAPGSPDHRREGLGPQLVAWTGGTVTLLGIVLLLILAAGRGWLQPSVRVVGGAVLALALVAVAAWVHGRPGGRTGAVALAATGVAGLYLDVVAATSLYEYLPVWGGLAVAVLVAGGGLALADRWGSQPLAAGAVAGAAVLAPVLTRDATPLLVGLAVVLQLAAAPVVWRRRWTVLAAVAAVWPVGYGLLAVARAAGEGEHAATTAAVVAVLLVGVGLAVAGATRLHTVYCGMQLASATVPVLSMALVLHRGPGALIAALVALLLFAIAVPVGRPDVRRDERGEGTAAGPSREASEADTGARQPSDANARALASFAIPRALRIVAMVVGAVAAFEATMIALRGGTQTAVVLGEAVALAAAAIAMRRRSPLVAAWVFGAIGTLLALGRDAPLRALLIFPSRPYLVRGEADRTALVTGAGVSLMVLATAVTVLAAANRLGLLGSNAESAPMWIAGVAVLLYGAAGLLVTLALLVHPTRGGFLTGHVLVTVSWTVAALVLLVRGIRQQALRVAGGVLVVAAVVKLIAFDLSQLDGVARVAAFIGAGIVLLAAGTRYGRLVSAAREAEDGAVQGSSP